MPFGDRLKEAREMVSLTRQQLAEKLGVTKSAISNYENGVSSPKEEVMLKIFTALRIEPNYLFQDNFATMGWEEAPLPQTTPKAQYTQLKMNDKIRALRKEHNLTLEAIGNIVGVGKSTVKKWEDGNIANMRRDKIAKLAQALHTTPAYLMGWEEAPLPQTTPKAQYTQAESKIIENYRTLNTEGQEKAADYIDDLVQTGKYKYTGA